MKASAVKEFFDELENCYRMLHKKEYDKKLRKKEIEIMNNGIVINLQ
jgi:hypothetical protein